MRKKKGTAVVLLAAIIGLLLVPMAAYAEEGDLLAGRSFKWIANDGATVIQNRTEATDGDDATFIPLTYPPTATNGAMVRYDVPGTFNLTHYKLGLSGSGIAYIRFDFTDGTFQLVSNPTVGNVKTAVTVSKPVKIIRVWNEQASVRNLYNFEVFGSEEPYPAGGLIRGKSIEYHTGNWNATPGSQAGFTNLVTDAKDDTVFTIRNSTNNNLAYRFPNGADINGYRVLGSPSAAVEWFFMDINGNIITRFVPTMDGMKKTITQINDVYAVVLGNTSTVTASNIAEMDVYGTLNPDTAAPSVPSNFRQTAIDVDKLTVSWDANSEPDLAEYALYRNGVKAATIPKTETEHTITGLLPDVSYSFTLTAIDEIGNESAKTAAVTFFRDTTGPDAPSGVTATAAGGGAVISWEASPGAVSYNVYDGSGAKLNSEPITVTSYTVTSLAQGTHSFTVKSVDESGNESPSSAAATVKIASPGSIGSAIINSSWGFTAADVWRNAIFIVSSLSVFILLGIAIKFAPEIIRLIRTAVLYIRRKRQV